MLFSRIVRVGAIVAALAVAGWMLAQSQPPSKQYVVVLKRGPKWVAGKPAGEQALGVQRGSNGGPTGPTGQSESSRLKIYRTAQTAPSP